MANYTAISFEECAAVLARSGHTLAHFSALKGGAANSSFHAVTAAGVNLVVTILDNHDASSATALGLLTDWLVVKGIETPPILYRNSSYRIAELNNKPVVLRPFIVGQQPTRLTQAQKAQVGASMAAYHRLHGMEGLGLSSRRLPTDWANDTKASAAGQVHRVVRSAEIEFENHPKLGTSLIHGDLFPDNMIWDHSGRLHTLDWETAALDWPPLDLGFTLVGLSGGGAFDQTHADALLAGYLQAGGEKPTSEDIRVGSRYAAAVLLFHRYRRHVLRQADPTKFDYWTKLLPFMDSVTP